MGLTLKAALIGGCLAGVAPGAIAAELQPRTNRAYDAYLEEAQRIFVARVTRGAGDRSGRDRRVSAGPGREDGIVGVPSGLVHHWVGRAQVRGATIGHVVDVATAYAGYSDVYRSIVASKLLDREGDTYQVLMRVRESEAGLSAVLEMRLTIRYVELTSRSVYAISNADEIREVKNAGDHDEYLLPVGRDSGYLWRANTFSYFLEEADGVHVEMETLGLSRRFPPLLGWLIEPIARRLGRKSVETSLQEFLAAVETTRPAIFHLR